MEGSSSIARSWALRLLASCGLLASPLAHALPYAPTFTITGAVERPATVDEAALRAQPAITQTDSFLAGTTPQSHTYTGASLWGALDASGIVVEPTRRNDLLDRYVLATASDGYRVAFSMGELSPASGNRPDLLAYSERIDGVDVPLDTDGMARISAPGDLRGGRYLSNLTNLSVGSAASLASGSGTGGGPSTSFSLSAGFVRPGSYDRAALEALPTVQRTVNGATYTGVGLWDLVQAAGLVLDPAVRNDGLGKLLIATGSDGYQVTFSIGELDPTFGNQPDFVAYLANGLPLGQNGFARLVVPNDVRAGRWVSNLVALEVVAPRAIPEPSTAALAWIGLIAFGLTVRRPVRR